MAEKEKIDPHFASLVFSLSAAAMQQMGKIANPITGKMEKNLEQARISIDMLEMLQEKTKGNLTNEEDKIIKNTLTDLQLNYVAELDKEIKSEQTSAN